jgi:transcriptional regulator
MPRTELDLLQGTLDVLVLKALSFGPRHGHAVALWIRATSDDDLSIEDGALYTALHRLEKRRLVEAEWGLSENNRRARYYELTAAGRRELRKEARRWSRYADAVFKVLRGGARAPAAEGRR